MSTEQKELDFLPDSSEIKRPILPVLDTQEMIDHMPEGKWQIPTEPYTLLERICADDLDFMKEDKRENFQAQCREMISDWMPFLDSAERGYQINKRVIEEGVLTPDLDSLESFRFFYGAFAPKFRQNEGLSFEEALTSTRNAFLNLMTNEQAEELGHECPEEISQEDSKNATFLVDRMAVYGTIFFPPIGIKR